MKLESFLNPENNKYQIQVIAPTFTYGTMYSLDSKYDFEINFDEYDTSSDWEFNVLIEGEIIATFNTLREIRNYIIELDS